MELRAGLVGLGMMGRNHARLLQSVEGIKLVAVAEPRGDPSRLISSDVALVETVDQLINTKVDICVVACPTEDHEKVGITLALAGVHTLIEKPLAADPEAALRLVQAFGSAGLVGAVGHIERSNAAIRSMRDRLIAGDLGEIYQVATRRLGPFPARIRDVGVVKDLATHDFDLAAWVGNANYDSITAHTSRRTARRYEDLVSATGILTNGIITNHLVNWLTPYKERVITATGERGCLIADTITADLTLYMNGVVPIEWDRLSGYRGVSEGDVIRFAIPKPEPLRTQLEGFRDTVLGKPDAQIVSLSEGLHAVAAADAAISSAHAGTTVSLSGIERS